MAGEKWRLPAAYRYTATLSRAGLAWEFLRRNPAFRAEVLAGTASPSAASSQRHAGDVARRWGLLFRAGP